MLAHHPRTRRPAPPTPRPRGARSRDAFPGAQRRRQGGRRRVLHARSAGKTLCVVGESGSGKSVTARSILQIVDAPGRIVSGSIVLHRPDGAVGRSRQAATRAAARSARCAAREIAMIFQEPMSSLSPVHTVGDQIIEVLRLHLRMGKADARARCDRASAAGRDPRAGARGRPLHLRVLRRHAPARDDRHGAGLQSAPC